MNKNLTSRLSVLALSAAIAFSGSVALAPKQAHASSATTASRIINFADNYLHRPYQFGARPGQTATFDCSSFTQYVYKHFGISLPRSSVQLSHAGTYVSRSQLKPGDLVFFWTSHSGPGHVGHVAIYVGNGRILHTYGSPGVTFSNMNSTYWSKHYVTARRVIR